MPGVLFARQPGTLLSARVFLYQYQGGIKGLARPFCLRGCCFLMGLWVPSMQNIVDGARVSLQFPSGTFLRVPSNTEVPPGGVGCCCDNAHFLPHLAALPKGPGRWASRFECPQFCSSGWAGVVQTSPQCSALRFLWCKRKLLVMWGLPDD